MPPHGDQLKLPCGPRYIASAQTTQKTPLPTVTPLLSVTQPLPGSGCFPGCRGLTLRIYGASFGGSYRLCV
jgi:hypothetical protein